MRPDGGAALRARWPALAGPDAVWVAAGELRARALGSDEVLVYAGGPASRARCRQAARTARLQVERELIVLPGLRRPMYLVEDAPESVEWFARNVLVVPPRIPLQGVAYVAVALLRRSWRLWGLVSPGRVLVGRVA